MANYLFLRGNRNKHFFSDVASELEEKGHTCYQLKFELGELLIPSKIKTFFVPRHITKATYPISDSELLNMKIYNITYKREMKHTDVSRKELTTYKRYMHYIDRFIEEYEIDTICMFNGYHWIDQVATYLAREKGLKTIFFEQGYFRPYTLTCDPEGINNDASLPRDKAFYQDVQVNKQRFDHHLSSPENDELRHVEGEDLTQVAFVKLVSMLGSVMRIHPNFYAHISWYEAVKYFLFKQAFKRKAVDQDPLPKEYLFIPFQVARDTQILYNSSIKSMEALVDLVYRHVQTVNEKHNRNIHLVFKEHPEDMPRNSYKKLKKRYEDDPNVLFFQKQNVNELIKKSLGVITINSTVGIEALAEFKPVITLGEAFYNIDGVVHHCSDLETLDGKIEAALYEPLNKTLITKFLYYLRFHYQLEGNLISRNARTAQNVAAHLDQVRSDLAYLRSEQNESSWSHTCKI
ncbi:capsular polysaccharide export protein, LipB/KpsS family [Halobacillus salinus]|uniref:capsular polysaccharide export protein, LipB/KpsS family n=1 Tax=Halobacillus salinus TaxID=192814 RepID=UPI0009A5AB51|nr:hypothetical protein [Halobacillus salinus]